MRSVSQAVVRGVLLVLIVVVAAASPPVHAAAAPSWPLVGKAYALTHDGSSVLADVSPDGRLVLYRNHVTGRDPGSLWIVERSGAGRREFVRHNVGLAFFLPDGRSILYNTSANIFRRIDLHGRLLPGRLDLSGLSWLPSADQYAGDRPIWLPDGRLVFARGTRLVAVDPLSGRRFALGRVTIPTEGGVYSSVLLSPNGRYVAFPRFTVPDTTPTATWIEDVRTGRVIIRVPAAARRSWQPEAWWPDSRSLFLFNDFTAGESRLVVPSGRLTGVPGLSGGIQTATWSPNGSTMAFARHVMGSCLYAMKVNFFRENGGLGPINDRIVVSEAPIWTGDGRALVYTLIDRVARPCGIPGTDLWVTPLRYP